jgi:hypothetical protein
VNEDADKAIGNVKPRRGGLLFGVGVGLLVALLSYQWITDPAPRAERQLEEAVVLDARNHLIVQLGVREIIDPLAPNRKIGKSYVYRAGTGWEVSGYYRRDDNDRWHAFLMSLDDALNITLLKVQDKALVERASEDSMLEVSP